jgi:hypothetical protein
VLKQFEQEQWELFDAPAKEAATKFWIQLGYECIENPDDFGIGLLVKGKGKEFGCEVEVKLGWHGPTFTFPTLHIAMRKKKFMNSPAIFMVMNNSITHGAVVSRKLILASPVIEVANATVPSGERFFNIPMDGVQIINLLTSNLDFS